MITYTVVSLPFSFQHTLYHSVIEEKRLHGHSCHLSFVFKNLSPKTFVKIEELKETLKQNYLREVDRSHLNEVLEDQPATSENLLLYLAKMDRSFFPPSLCLAEIRLKETDKNTIHIKL